jgi:transposase InsO family protein
MKYSFIKKHRSEFRVEKMCQVLGIVSSCYYYWLKRKPSKREQKNNILLREIKKIHTKRKRTYGSPRITAELRENGYVCSRPRVARIMRRAGIYAKTKRKFKVTTQSKHNYPISPNLLGQNFKSNSPNTIWTSDITYIWTRQGWLYLAVVLDLFNREIVGWSMSNRLTASTTTIPSLIQACNRRRPESGLIYHSDQGIQYASKEFRENLKKHGMIQSMSNKGNCYDNAVTESFFHTLKTELVYFEKYDTREEARNSVFEYIEIFYNRERKHSTLGYKTPVEFMKLKNAA